MVYTDLFYKFGSYLAQGALEFSVAQLGHPQIPNVCLKAKVKISEILLHSSPTLGSELTLK